MTKTGGLCDELIVFPLNEFAGYRIVCAYKIIYLG
jgi:hypothetical protein